MRNTRTTSGATLRLTISRPRRTWPSKATYETVNARSPDGATGQPACHDGPSCAEVTGAIVAWYGGSAAIGDPAYSGRRDADAGPRTGAPRAGVPATNRGHRALGAVDNGLDLPARVRPPSGRPLAGARRLPRRFRSPSRG